MRLALFAIAGLLAVGGTALAEPPKSTVAKPAAQPQQKPAPILLASADAAPATSDGAASSAAPAKRRVAPRVTTCRCGDPHVDPEPQDQ